MATAPPLRVDTIQVLPDEMLVMVFRYIRHSEIEQDEEQRIACLYVSRRFLNWGRGPFYRDIVAGNHNVDSFTDAVANRPSDFAVTRTLTVRLTLGWQAAVEQDPEAYCGGWCGQCAHPYLSDDEEYDAFGEELEPTVHGLNHHGRINRDLRPMNQLGERIVKLAKAIPRLCGLTTFSFTIDADSRDPAWCGCYEPIFARRPLAQLIVALPKRCVNLELDTDGTERTGYGYLPWDHDPTTNEDDLEELGIEKVAGLTCTHIDSDKSVLTLCEAIYKVLPQLEHLRLRCSMLCPNIFGLTHALRVNAPPATLDQDFPKLKTFVLNQMLRGMDGIIHICGDYTSGTRAWDTDVGDRESVEFAGALSHCRNFFPNLEKCHIISSRPLDVPSPTGAAAYTALQPWRNRLRRGQCQYEQVYDVRSYDVLQNKTTVMPFESIKQNLSDLKYSLYPASWEWNLFRDQDQEVSIGSLRQIETAVEDAWYSTTTGVRFTKDFKESNAADEEMIWVAVGGGTQAQYESFPWDRRYWNRLPEPEGRWEDVGDTSGFEQALPRGARIEYFDDDADAEGAGLSVYQEALKREVESFDGYVG